MRILLINPKTEGYSRSFTVPLGLLSIASVLSENGHTVRLYDRTVERISEADAFGSFSPDIVGISLVSTKSIKDMLYLAGYAKKRGLTVVVGGPLASEMPEAVLRHRDIDIVSIGEGEATWTELVRCFEEENRFFEDISGIAFIKDGKCFYTAERDFIDLGSLPPLNWELVDVPKYFQASYGCDKMLYLYSAKGCPNNCMFCYNRDFHRCRYRKRPIGMLLDEIKYLVEHHGMNGVYFADELWCRDRSEMKATCDALASLNLDFVWGCQTRIGQFSEEDFRYMYAAGCRWVFFGVESGSPRMLELMNKRIPYEKIIPTFSDCKKAGITAIGSFIIGFPGDTEQDMRETVTLIEKLDTDFINLNYFALVPGSDIYKKLVAENKFKAYDDIARMAEIRPIEKIEYRFCDIPVRDMKVIHSWYMWRSFSSKSSETGKGHSFAVKTVADAVRSMMSGGVIDFFKAAFYSGTEFLSIFYYAHAYPVLKKKYISRR